MRLLSFSGGATKAAALAAHANMLRGYNPQIMGGVSAGALIMLPVAMNMHSTLKDITTNLSLSDIFDNSPINRKGRLKLSAYIRAIRTGSFGSTKALYNTFRSVVSENEYYELMEAQNTPEFYVGVTNATENKLDVVYLNKLPYEEATHLIIASCTIPIYCPPVRMGNNFYYDGGVKAHNIASELIRKYGTYLEEVKSVYTNQKGGGADYDWSFNGKFVDRNISKTFDLLQKGVSIENQKTEVNLCNKYGIKLTQYFSPNVMESLYDVDNKRLLELYNKVIESHAL